MTTPKWLDPKLTLGNVIQIVLLAITAVGLYYSIIGRVDATERDVTELKSAVLPIPGLVTAMQVNSASVTASREARDKQIVDIVGRQDRLETTVSAKLDKMTDAIGQMRADIAALTAVVKQQGNSP